MSILDTIKKTLQSKSSPAGEESQIEAKRPTAQRESKRESARPSAKISFGLLKGVHITEKSTFLQADRKYIFKVSNAANKPEIKKAIERIYKVKVSDVNIIQKRNKKVRLGRYEGVSSGNKKAIVTLQDGYKIEMS